MYISKVLWLVYAINASIYIRRFLQTNFFYIDFDNLCRNGFMKHLQRNVSSCFINEAHSAAGDTEGIQLLE